MNLSSTIEVPHVADPIERQSRFRANPAAPTSVINASAAGVFIEALAWRNIEKVYGAAHGIVDSNEISIDMAQGRRGTSWNCSRPPLVRTRFLPLQLAILTKTTLITKRILRCCKYISVISFTTAHDSMDTAIKYPSISGSPIRVPRHGVPRRSTTICGARPLPWICLGGQVHRNDRDGSLRGRHVYDVGMVCVIEIMGTSCRLLTAASALAGQGTAPISSISRRWILIWIRSGRCETHL